MSQPRRRIAFVTGKLAEVPLRETVERLAADLDFEPVVLVAKISVAALMTPSWLVGKLTSPGPVERVLLPGWCSGDLSALSASLGGAVVELGPKDLRDLPQFFQQASRSSVDYGRCDVEILAEINHADRLSLQELMDQAELLSADGADVVDLGCTPGAPWLDVGEAAKELTARGFRISVDTFDPQEAALACAGGASLVLSVHRGNWRPAVDWGAEVVVVPEHPSEPDWADQIAEAVDGLREAKIPYRIDPILEPIGFGFARSLGRYLQARERFTEAPMMMGIGNLTELTAVDSAGVNALLMGFCQELRIHSVLTTQVINWARSSTAELAVARQLMHYAVAQKSLPKGIDDRLVMLRDPKLQEIGEEDLLELSRRISDRNIRLFAERGEIFAVSRNLLDRDADPFELFKRLGISDPSHAFYLGWEMMKASLALQLGKRYVQDEALRFGLLTREEVGHRNRRRDFPEGADR